MNNIKDTAYNIVSKLDFKSLDNTSVIVDTFKDENVPSIFTWDVSDKSNISVSESNGLKVITVKSNNAGIYAQANKYNNPVFPNFKNANFELEIELEIENVNAENIYFGIVGTNNGVLLFNITNKTIGGFEIFSNGRHVKFNYKFESNVKYNVMVTKNSNKYTLYINGLCVGTSTDATAFINNININDIPTFTIAKAQPASNDNSQFKGKYFGLNLSIYGTKYNKSFTKYGDKLLSRYNFSQLQWDGATTTTRADVEAVYNAPFKWTLDVPISTAVGDWYKNNNKFVSKINNIFTIQFEIKNTNNSNITLSDMGEYKVLYSLIKQGEPEPQVIVNSFATSAIDYENGGIDKISSTVWEYGSNTKIQSKNTIFGDNCLEIIDVTGNSLFNSQVNTTARLLDSQRPYTIEFYSVIKGKMGLGDHTLFSQSLNQGSGEQFISVGNGFKTRYSRENAHQYLPMISKDISPDTIRYNEINKFTMSYDGSAIRLFVNDKLQQLKGSAYGWNSTGGRFLLMNSLVPDYPSYQFTTIGLMDNVNIFDNEARLVREYDKNENFLVCDLQFDGYSGTNKFIDNAPSKPTWSVLGNNSNAFMLYDSSSYFTTGISFFSKNEGNTANVLRSMDVDLNFMDNVDFTLSFEFVRKSDELYGILLGSAVTDYAKDITKINYVSVWGSSYTNITYWANRLTLTNEKHIDEHKNEIINNPNGVDNFLISKTIFELNKRYKIDIIRKNGYIYLYVNNQLDNFSKYENNIEFSPSSIGACIGGIPFSSSQSFYGLNYLKAYKGVAIFPKNDNNRLTLNFDNNLQDTHDYYRTKTWVNNNNVTYVNDDNSINGSATKYGDSTYQYINSGKNDKLNYGYGNFDISFDIKNTNQNSSKLEVVAGSGGTSVVNTTSEIQLFAFHYQSNDYGTSTNVNELKSTIGWGIVYNGLDYAQYKKAIRNTYYNVRQLRIGNAIVQKVNDVTCNIANYNMGLPLNFNFNDNTTIGRCLWRGQDAGGQADSQFTGYIDNFKSIKDDLTYSVSKFSNATKAKIINKNNYLSIAPYEFNKFAVAQIDDAPLIDRGTIEVEHLVHENKGTILGLCVENWTFDNTTNDTYGYIMTIERDNSGIFSGFYRGSENGQSSSMININRGISIGSGDICKSKIVIVDGFIKCYINDILIHDIARNVTRKTPIALRNWMSNSSATNPNTEMLIKSIKMSKPNGEEIYYRDWKTSINNTIDRPVIDLPLIKNSVHYGTSFYTIDNYNTNPEFKMYQGRECAVISNNRSLQINYNSNGSFYLDNPFDLGKESDFYMEMEFFIEDTSQNKNKYHTLLCDKNTSTNELGGQLAIGDQNDATYSSKLYFRRLKGQDISMISTDKILYGQWNKMKFYRKNGITHLDLNDKVVSRAFDNISFVNSSGTHFGRAGFNPDAYLNGAISNFILFVGRYDKPENYDSKKVIKIDFTPTRKSYLIRDEYNKHVVHPTNLSKRGYENSKYCGVFTGTEYLQLGQTQLLYFATNDFMINFKFEYNKLSGNVYLLSSGQTSWQAGCVFITINTEYKIMFSIGGIGTLYSSDAVNDGYNDLVLYRENGVIKMRLNGKITTDTTNLGLNLFNFNANNNTLIGKSAWENTYFKGFLYEVKMFINTADLTLLDDDVVTSVEEKFTLTNGTDSQEILFDVLNEDKKIKITSDDSNIILGINDKTVEVNKTSNITDIKLFENYKGEIKDLRVYDVAFTDEDVYVGTEWINTTMPEIEITDDVEELEIYDIGEYKVKGFIEGYTDRKFQIYNNNYNYVVYSGIEDYEFEIDENSLNDIEVQDLVNGQKYPLYTHEMIKGFISGTVNLDSCGVKGDEMKVYCFRSDNNRFIGFYDINTLGKYEIPNLDVNSRYDIVFKTVDRKLENISSSYRQPKKY